MSGISLPIIDALEHPPIGALSRHAAPANPYSGPFVSLTPSASGVFKVYGLCLKINSVGAFHGRDVSFPIQYDPPLGKIACEYQDLTGFLVIQQVELWTFDDQWYVWNEPLPGLVDVYMQPDVTANLFWLGTPI